MAEQDQNKPKTFLGLSPAILAVAGLGLVAIIVLLAFPDLRGGSQAPVGVPVTQSQAPPQDAALAAGAQKQPAEKTTPANGATTAVRVEDPLSTFLVSFGRANTFAPIRGGARGGSTGSTSGPSLDALRARVQNLQSGRTGSGEQGGTGQTESGFVLTGIVRAGSHALAVIIKDKKPYYVSAGGALGKTGYTCQEIGEDRVTIAAGGKTLVLVFRKPPTSW